MTESQAQSFTFIHGNPLCQTTQETIRVHVMRLHHSQRRQAQKSKQRIVSGGQFEGHFHLWQPDQDVSAKQAEPPTPVSISASSPDSPHHIHDTPDDDSPRRELTPPTSLELLTGTSNGQRDAPTPTRKFTERILIKHYLQYGGGSKLTADFLRAYRESTATFSAFLAIVATNYSDETSAVLPIDVTELENTALRDVANQLARSPTAPASSTMLTVAILANLRHCRREDDLVKWHWNGLKQMVDINGGAQRLRVQEDLYAFFFWLEAVVLSTNVSSLGQLPCTSTDGKNMKEELFEFLRDVSAKTSMPIGGNDDSYPRLSGGVLRAMCQPSFKKDSYSMGKWRRAKLACLIYLAALALRATCRLEDDSDYRAIEADVLEREREYIVYPEELYYVLVLLSNQDRVCYSAWMVARFINTIKLLEQRDVNTCYRLLASYLRFTDPYGSDMEHCEWVELYARMSK